MTFFLMDLEGSTRLWEIHLAAMPSVIAELEAAVAEVAEEHGGRLLKERGEGDSSFVVFTDATKAAVAAVALQLRVKRLEESLPFPLHLRIAINTGSVILSEATTSDRWLIAARDFAPSAMEDRSCAPNHPPARQEHNYRPQSNCAC